MNTLNGLPLSETETHSQLTHEVSATPSLEFLREVAQFLEIEAVQEGLKSKQVQQGCFCEVIGCGKQAFWFQVSRQDSHSEDWLCNTHWELLHLHDPQRASRYKHLPSLLAVCQFGSRDG